MSRASSGVTSDRRAGAAARRSSKRAGVSRGLSVVSPAGIEPATYGLKVPGVMRKGPKLSQHRAPLHKKPHAPSGTDSDRVVTETAYLVRRGKVHLALLRKSIRAADGALRRFAKIDNGQRPS